MCKKLMSFVQDISDGQMEEAPEKNNLKKTKN